MVKIARLGKKSITKRWIFNNFFVVFLILVVIDLGFIFAVQNFYYNSAKDYLKSKIMAIDSTLRRYSEDSGINFSGEIRRTVESFADKDKMELMAINSKGAVVLTSSGFTPNDDLFMPDYDNMTGEELVIRIYTDPITNEKVMALSYPVSSISNDYSAIRVVSSMKKIDDYIFTITIVITSVCIIILLLLAFSGFYFVGTIVKPIQQINKIATKYAKGDFSKRISNNSEDEIGNLCVAINHMAEELSHTESMKNEFISSVSHELRTPLTAIKGWAETLNEVNDIETVRKGIRVIINETERLSQMVEELLGFSRMQSGRFTLQKENMDILAELGEAVLIYTEKAKREGIEIIYNEPEMLPIVVGDKNRLRQVFINIIDNAIKYTNSGERVIIEASELEDKVQIIVEDTGVGIKASDLSKIKTKFYKANHTKRGSGIGLAVADEIVAMHGGKLDVLSEEGVGTTVVITLPVEKKLSDGKGNSSGRK